MSDNKGFNDSNNSEELFDDAEYQKALEALNSSKTSRVAKKQKKEEVRKAKTSEASGDSFIEKCKKDPVIPVCIAALAVIVAFAAYYLTLFVIGLFGNDNLGMDLNQFRTQYKSTAIYNDLLSLGGFDIPEVTYSDETGETNADGSAVIGDELYFMAAVPNNSGYGALLNGSCDKKDLKLSELKVALTYQDNIGSQLDRFLFIDFYFSSYLEVFAGDLTENQIEIIVAQAIMNDASESYYVYGDFAFKVTSQATGEGDSAGHLIVMEIMPKSHVSSELRTEVQIPAAETTFQDYLYNTILNSNG